MGEEKDSDRKPAAGALSHPTRIRILEVVNETDMSPVQFLQLGLVGDPSQANLSHVSYHFRTLEQDGCLEVVGQERRRGATEHVYRGRARAFLSDDDCRGTAALERAPLSRAIYQGLAARVEGAMLSKTFDSREDMHLTWIQCDVDERGWTEAMRALLACFARIAQIRTETRQRLADGDAPRVPLTVGLLGFESSPAGAIRPDDDPPK